MCKILFTADQNLIVCSIFLKIGVALNMPFLQFLSLHKMKECYFCTISVTDGPFITSFLICIPSSFFAVIPFIFSLHASFRLVSDVWLLGVPASDRWYGTEKMTRETTLLFHITKYLIPAHGWKLGEGIRRWQTREQGTWGNAQAMRRWLSGGKWRHRGATAYWLLLNSSMISSVMNHEYCL